MDERDPRLTRHDWIPEEAIAALQTERIVRPEKTNVELAMEILSENAPLAAMAVAQIATNSANESLRLKAAQYIIDGVVGGGFKGDGTIDDTLMALVQKLAENDNLTPTERL